MLENYNEKIRNKMLKSVLLVVSISLLILIVITLVIVRKKYIVELTKECQYVVNLAASKIEGWVNLNKIYMETLAHLIEKDHQSIEFDEMFFQQYLSKYSVHEIFMGFSDGKFIGSSNEAMPDDYDPRHEKWYLMALYKKALIFTSPYADRHSKIVVTMAMPVYSNKYLIGVLGMDIPLHEIFQVIHKLEVGTRSRAHLVDESGVYLVNEDEPKKVLKGNIFHEAKEGPLLAGFISSKAPPVVYENGHYIVFHRIPVSLWYIIFYMPASEVNQPLKSLYLIFGAGLILTIIILTIAIILISNLISRPILNLVNGANDISTGNYGLQLDVNSRDEIGFLTHTFNKMSDGLKEREFIRSTFGRYVSEDVAREILESPAGLDFGGKKEKVSIMMTDLRGFTTLSENLPPESVVSILNYYLEKMTDTIVKYKGTIDEFIGDAILVIFGSPVTQPDHAATAVAAAIEMQNEMADINAWNKERDYPEIHMGIGINTGYVVVGNIGSEKRSKFAVVGRHVNLASRIESYTVGGQILISSTTKDDIGLILETDGQYEVNPKGVDKPITIYSVSGLGGKYDVALNKEQRIQLVDVKEKRLIVKYNIFDGKSKGAEAFKGEVLKLSIKGTLFSITENSATLKPFDNIQLELQGENGGTLVDKISAKVLEVTENKEIELRFTTLAKNADYVIEKLLAS